MTQTDISFEEGLFLEWLRQLTEDELELVDHAVEHEQLMILPFSILSSYPHQLLEIATPERG